VTAPSADVAAPLVPADEEREEEATTRGRGRWLLVALAVLLALLALAMLVLGLRLRSAAAEQDAREDALRYASQLATNLTSISVQDLDADFEQVLDGATGEFEQDFSERSANLRQVLTTNEVVSEGTVLEAALVRADDETATALVVVDATVRNKANPQGGVTTYRMKLELERQGERWLTSTLEFVG